jgi:hypothetical protein
MQILTKEAHVNISPYLKENTTRLHDNDQFVNAV